MSASALPVAPAAFHKSTGSLSRWAELSGLRGGIVGFGSTPARQQDNTAIEDDEAVVGMPPHGGPHIVVAVTLPAKSRGCAGARQGQDPHDHPFGEFDRPRPRSARPWGEASGGCAGLMLATPMRASTGSPRLPRYPGPILEACWRIRGAKARQQPHGAPPASTRSSRPPSSTTAIRRPGSSTCSRLLDHSARWIAVLPTLELACREHRRRSRLMSLWSDTVGNS